MAQLVECEDWTEPDSLAMHLHHDLGEEYVVVANPTVQRRELDVVVVGPQGLFVLQPSDAGDGEAVAQTMPEEQAEPAPGPGGEAPQLAAEEPASPDTVALEAFLRDEFPSLTPEIRHIRVSMGRGGDLSNDVPSATPVAVAQQISSTEVPETGAFADRVGREELAVALRDRGLTVSQRASAPFVFRSGHALRSGTEVWSIREAVRHMDAHPESGIYHLRNDTLARWFSDQGARHLARLAREVIREETDHRVALETFLIGTGLVARPHLDVQPAEIDLGYLLAGDSVARHLSLRKGGGRGYLFGTLEPSSPWLSVHPREFSGESSWSVVTVRAETGSLRITRKPRQEAITIHSNATAEPRTVPVRFRVVGLPSALNRTVLRPGAGLLVAGVLGAAAGWALAAPGAPAAKLLAGLSWLPVAPVMFWVVIVALIWSALGAARGATQPLAWPVSYATGRWLCRVGVWGVSLGLTGAAAAWAWGGLRAVTGASLPQGLVRLLIVAPVCLAIIPATIGEIRAARDMGDTSMRAIRWSFLRPLLLPVAAFFLALVLRTAAPMLQPVLERVDWEGALSTVRAWVREQLERLERGIQGLMDELYRRYYEG